MIRRSPKHLKILVFPKRGSHFQGPRVSKPQGQNKPPYPPRIPGGVPGEASPVGAGKGLWTQFWATLAFQSVTDGPPEKFWGTAGLKILRFVQFVAHMGAFGPLLVNLWSPAPPQT